MYRYFSTKKLFLFFIMAFISRASFADLVCVADYSPIEEPGTGKIFILSLNMPGNAATYVDRFDVTIQERGQRDVHYCGMLVGDEYQKERAEEEGCKAYSEFAVPYSKTERASSPYGFELDHYRFQNIAHANPLNLAGRSREQMVYLNHFDMFGPDVGSTEALIRNLVDSVQSENRGYNYTDSIPKNMLLWNGKSGAQSRVRAFKDVLCSMF